MKVVTAKRLKTYFNDAGADSFGSEIEREIDIGRCCADEITEVATPVPWDSDNELKQPVAMAYDQGAANQHFANRAQAR